MIRIAIDGPGGAGKSSVAKAVAKELGIIYVDTGALYRTIGLYMLNHGVDPKNTDEVTNRLNDFSLELAFIEGKQVILLDGKDVGDTIRTPEVSMAASAVSAIPEVRDYLLNTQRDIAKKNSVIMDGRDIGTVILPDAEVKIFLTASPEARAKRRYDELIARGQEVTYEQVYNEMVERDKNDSTRVVAPCVPAKDAIKLDNSKLDFEGTVKRVLGIITKKERKLNKTSFYFWLQSIVLPIVKFFFKLKVTGAENVPLHGGFLLASNHIAKRDVIMIGVACRRKINFIAKKELFAIPILSSIIRGFGAVPVDRGSGDVAAIKKSVSLLEDGNVVCIFPQGHRYPKVNPTTTPRRNGAAMIAYRAGVPIIPVSIKTKGLKYGLFKEVEIIFGKPVTLNELGVIEGGNKEYHAATEEVMTRISKQAGFDVDPELNQESEKE